jgi:hypothetical protein
MAMLEQLISWYDIDAQRNATRPPNATQPERNMARTHTERYSWGTLDIDYDYQPAEPAVSYTASGSGCYPGCPESLEITAIWYTPAHGGATVNLTPLLNEEMFSVETLAAFEERILESMEQASPDEE